MATGRHYYSSFGPGDKSEQQANREAGQLAAKNVWCAVLGRRQTTTTIATAAVRRHQAGVENELTSLWLVGRDPARHRRQEGYASAAFEGVA
eukprot:COSAG05_NODE_885_length_6763_cov_10.115396_1_plen_92_part_00